MENPTIPVQNIRRSMVGPRISMSDGTDVSVHREVVYSLCRDGYSPGISPASELRQLYV
jgi:hypothetical protein